MVSSGEIVRAQVGQIHGCGSTLTPNSKPVASARCRKPARSLGDAARPVEKVEKKLQAVIETTRPRTQRSILVPKRDSGRPRINCHRRPAEITVVAVAREVSAAAVAAGAWASDAWGWGRLSAQPAFQILA